MIRTITRWISLASATAVTGAAALAHPGHDHSGSGHGVHEMPAGNDNTAIILLGLAVLVGAGVGYRMLRSRASRRD